MKTKGYALFLIPQGKVYKNLVHIISNLAQTYYVPLFEPHVTLLGYIMDSPEQVVDKTKKLASMIKPYEIELSKINFLDDYLRCLFIEAKKTKLVIEANQKARQVFNQETNQKYLPHLSLMYGDFLESLKKEIVKNYQLDDLKLSFMVDRIYLYNTDGEIKDWKKVAEFKLTGN